MVHVIFRAVILVALLAGGREFLESRASKILEVAQEQHEDKLYDESLETLRSLDSWLSWTRAGAEGDELREEVRLLLTKKRRRAEADAQYEQQMRDIESDRKERERRDELDRQHERYYAGLGEARRQADADRQMQRSRDAAERINRNNKRALRNARRGN